LVEDRTIQPPKRKRRKPACQVNLDNTAGTLALYEAACRAITEARSVDEIKDIHGIARQMAAAARVAQNRDLEADAFEIRVRAERRLGEMMTAAKAAGDLASGPGRPRQNGSGTEPFRATLAEAGITKKLSATAQHWHAMPRDAFDAMIAEGRAEKQRACERRTLKTIELAQARAAYEAKAERGGTISDLHELARTGKRFPVIYADPPWRFYNYSGQGAVDDKYATMSLDDIMALPVGPLAAADCALFLWATWPTLLEAIATIEAWGFTYKTGGFVWVKTRGNGNLHIGLGYHTRANSELVLLATRGNPHRLARDVHQIVLAPVAEHSAKPDEVHHRIERLYAGPYLELFARRAQPGWHCWGNEIMRLREAAE